MRSHVRALVAAFAGICGCAGILGVDDVEYAAADGGAAGEDAADAPGSPDAAQPDAPISSPDAADHADSTAPSGARLYAVAGGTDFWNGVNTVHSAPILPDGTLGPWASEKDLPSARLGAHTVNVQGRVVALYGRPPDGGGADNDVLLFGDAGWSDLVIGPASFRHAAVAVGSNVYVLGGFKGASGLGSPDLYALQVSPSMVVLQNFGQVTRGLWGHAMATDDTSLFTAGGAVNDGATEIFASDETTFGGLTADGGITGAFSLGPPLKVGRMMAQLVHVGGHLYVIGGFNGSNTAINAIEVSTLVAHVPQAWSITPTPLPGLGRGEHCAVAYGGRIYVLGGVSARDGGALSEVLVSTVAGDGSLSNWTPLTALPAPMGWLGCTVR